MRLHEPTSVDDACRLLAADPEGTMALSGGTALVLMLRQGFVAPDDLVSLRAIDALRGIDQHQEVLRIGASETLRDVAASPLVGSIAPSLAAGCREVGNTRVRNVATIGGNLAESDYSSDPPAILASLGASCRIEGPAGTRSIAVSDFITGFFENVLDDGELVADVEIPLRPDRRAVYLKYRSRSSEDRACVGVAAAADFVDGIVSSLDVVVGAVAPTLQRFPDIGAIAIGSALDQEHAVRIADAYAESIDPMEDARGSSWYRRKMIRVFVRRALEALHPGRLPKEASHG